MKDIPNFLKTFSAVFLLGIISVIADAQKLPAVQQASLRPPVNIKIDGKATEWNNQFQAYNHAANIFYNIANDDKNLYLTVQTPDPGIINKILFGGVSLTVNSSGKKNLKEAANITYPVFEKGKQNMVYINFSDTKAGTDSFAMANNSKLIAKSKFIRVTGIKGIDTLISIYNQDGIKAVSLFDNKMAYTYELAVDLSLLDFDTAKPEKFAYNISLPGLRSVSDEFAAALERRGIQFQVLSVVYTRPAQAYNPSNPHGYPVDVPTDFWGEYTLAKQQ